MSTPFDYLIPELGYFALRTCPPKWCIGKEVIDFHDLTYIINGKAVYYINGKACTVEKGDLLYVSPGSERQAHLQDESPFEVAAANFQFLPQYGDPAHRNLPFQTVTSIGINKALIAQYQKLQQVWIEKDECCTMESRAIFGLILSNLVKELYFSKPTFNFDKRIEHIKHYINENFASEISIEELAAQVSLNSIYLGVLFKKTVGVSIREYINRVRVNNAETILNNDNFSVSDAAAKCGFDDVFYFSRVFKKIKGVSPSNLIKK